MHRVFVVVWQGPGLPQWWRLAHRGATVSVLGQILEAHDSSRVFRLRESPQNTRPPPTAWRSPRRRLLSRRRKTALCARTPRCHELPAARRRSQAPRLRSGMASQQWRDKRCALCCLLLRSASRPVPRDQQTGAQELPEEAAAAAAANLEQVNAQLEASGESTLTFDDVCFDAKRLHNGGGKRCFDVVQKERNAGGDRRGTRSS